MAPKKTHKLVQETMLEEPAHDREVSLEFIGEEELRAQEDHDDLESEED
jgi:hypothetical protein